MVDKKSEYPLFYAFGPERLTFLSGESAEAATVNERIKSVWPFITGKVLAFQSTLKPRDAANFDPEDTLTELWVVLAESDSEWEPARGKYITFAGTVIDRELCSIRDRARTVHSPRNSSSRMKDYRKIEEVGGLTDRREKTRTDIRRTFESVLTIAQGRGVNAEEQDEVSIDIGDDTTPLDTVQSEESRRAALDAVMTAIRKSLTLDEITVLGRLTGVWGREVESVQAVSEDTQRPASEIRRVKSRAYRKVRDYLAAVDHPFVDVLTN